MPFFLTYSPSSPTRPISWFSDLAAQILRSVLTGALAISLLPCSGCESSENSRPAPPEVVAQNPPTPVDDLFLNRPFRTIEPRIYALRGRPLLIPILLAPGVGPGDGVRVDLDDGPPADARLARVGVVPGPSSSPEEVWSNPGLVGRWIAETYPNDNPQLKNGAWIVAINLSSPEKLIRIDRVPVPLVWLNVDLGPGDAVLRRAAARFWTPSDLPETIAWLRPSWAAPPVHWRARYAAAAMGGFGVLEPEWAKADVRGELAEQGAWRWQAALSRVAEADPKLAELLAERLLAGMRTGPGLVVPAWAPDGPELERLLDALLDSSLGPPEFTVRARSWLAAQPHAVAWVLDDAGRTDAISGDVIATVGAANLSHEPALCWARSGEAPSSRISEELTSLAPWSASSVSAICPAAGSDPSVLGQPLSARVGQASSRLIVLARPAPVNPPGLSIGPFAADWTLPRWLTGGALAEGPRQEPAPSAAAALLFRARPQGADAPQWQLYLECAESEPAAAESEPAGFLRVWIGPYGHPAAVLRITSDGAMFDQTLESRSGPPSDAPPAAAGAALRTLQVLREKDRWRVWLPIAPAVIGPDGLLRLGIQRVDAQGRRSAWPRAMMPWQTEPGRASLDTRNWDALNDGR